MVTHLYTVYAWFGLGKGCLVKWTDIAPQVAPAPQLVGSLPPSCHESLRSRHVHNESWIYGLDPQVALPRWRAPDGWLWRAPSPGDRLGSPQWRGMVATGFQESQCENIIASEMPRRHAVRKRHNSKWMECIRNETLIIAKRWVYRYITV